MALLSRTGLGGNLCSMSRPIISRTMSFWLRAPLSKVSMCRPLRNTREPVAERLDLVHAVRDEEHADALGLQLGEHVVDGVDVAAGERRGRLVEDEELGVLAQRLGDLDHLPARQRQVADQRARIDVLAVDARQQLLGAVGAAPCGR